MSPRHQPDLAAFRGDLRHQRGFLLSRPFPPPFDPRHDLDIRHLDLLLELQKEAPAAPNLGDPGGFRYTSKTGRLPVSAGTAILFRILRRTAGSFISTPRYVRNEGMPLCQEGVKELHAVQLMRVGPSEPSCRRRLQTAMSGCRPMAMVVNVMVKRRGKTASGMDERGERK